MIIKAIRKLGFMAGLMLLPIAACASHPKCDGPENWAASMAFVHLKNAGVAENKDLDFDKTQVKRIASQKVEGDIYVQVHRVTFTKQDGSLITVIAQNKASNSECSEGPVTIYQINRILGGS